MELLLILYATTFIPVNAGQYTQALEMSRDAIVIQSGARAAADKVKDQAKGVAMRYAREQGVAKPAAVLGWAAMVVKNKECELKTEYGTFKVTPNSVTYAINIAF